MLDWYVIFTFCGLLLGLLTLSIFLLYGNTYRFANRLLAACFFSMTLVLLYLFFNEKKIFEIYPHLYRTGSPFFFLIAPCFYLYCRVILYDETRFRKWDWLHFMPATLHFIQLIPFYLKPASYKLSILKSFESSITIIRMEEGGLPPFFVFSLRSLIGMSYVIAVLILIRKYLKENPVLDTYKKKMILWFRVLNLVQFIIWGPYFLLLLNLVPNTNLFPYYALSIILTFLFSTLFLQFNPSILYGLPRDRSNNPFRVNTDPAERTHSNSGNSSPVPDLGRVLDPASASFSAGFIEKEAENVSQEKHSGIPSQLLSKYALEVKSYFATEKPYLKKGYTLGLLSKETGIPVHHLSATFNQFLGTRFNDFLNQYRVNYLNELARNKDWKKFTMEGIGNEAGFKTKSTFFNAIRKFTGLTPMEFFSRFEEDRTDRPIPDKPFRHPGETRE